MYNYQLSMQHARTLHTEHRMPKPNRGRERKSEKNMKREIQNKGRRQTKETNYVQGEEEKKERYDDI